MPDKEEINFLLEIRVRDSDVIAVRGNCEDYSEIVAHVNLLYAALYDKISCKSKIGMLKDKTASKLRLIAAQTIQNTAQCMLERQIEDITFTVSPVQQEQLQIDKPEKKDDTDKTSLADFSKN